MLPKINKTITYDHVKPILDMLDNLPNFFAGQIYSAVPNPINTEPRNNPDKSKNNNNEIPIDLFYCNQMYYIIEYINTCNINNNKSNIACNSTIAYDSIREFLASAQNMLQFKSKHSIINCYQDLIALKYNIDSLYITYDNDLQERLTELVQTFIPFQEYVENNIYNKIETQQINLKNLYKMAQVLEKIDPEQTRTFEINYILKSIITIAREINNKIEINNSSKNNELLTKDQVNANSFLIKHTFNSFAGYLKYLRQLIEEDTELYSNVQELLNDIYYDN